MSTVQENPYWKAKIEERERRESIETLIQIHEIVGRLPRREVYFALFLVYGIVFLGKIKSIFEFIETL